MIYHFYLNLFVSWIEIWSFNSSNDVSISSLTDLDTPTVGISTLTPLEGETLNFTCKIVTSDTVHNFTWYHNNVEVKNQTTQISQLYDGKRNHSGNYSCEVTTISLLQKISENVLVTYWYCFLRVVVGRLKKRCGFVLINA